MKFFVDTSVWIDFFKGLESPSTNFVRQSLADGNEVFSHAIIIQEILQGFKNDQQATEILPLLQGLTFLNYDQDDAEQTAAIYRALRKSGRTLSTIDVLIAHLCIKNKLTLVTLDTDFKNIPKLKLLS